MEVPTDEAGPAPQQHSVVLVAHRSGNDPDRAAAVGDRADVIELDAHVHRGRVEVRHEKVLRPSSRLWERWYLLPRGTRGVDIEDVLRVVDPGWELMVDLKCFTQRAARRIRGALGDERPLIVSSRSWWVLRAFRDRPDTRSLRSCSSPRQLWLARRLPGLSNRSGIVAHERLLARDTVAMVRARTPLLFSWGVASVSRGRDLAGWGVTGLIVDDLDLAWPRGALPIPSAPDTTSGS